MTNTSTTRASLDASADIDVSTTVLVLWFVGIERRVRRFPLRFRSTTSARSRIPSDVVAPAAVRTPASVWVAAMPVACGTSSTPDATSAYLDVGVGPA